MSDANVSSAEAGAGDVDVLSDCNAIKNTCEYISQVVSRFNAQMDHLPGESKEQIMLMNRDLIKALTPNTGINVGSSGQGINLRNVGEATAPQIKNTNFSKQDKKVGSGSSSASEVTDGGNCSSLPKVDRKVNPVSQLRHNVSEGGILSVDQLMDLFQRLDSRTVPKPEKFDSTSGQSFKEFLNMFEEYCQNNFRGSTRLWIAELGRLLSGDMLSAFETLRGTGDSYETVKSKLLQWQQDSSESRSADIKAKFTKCKMKPGEKLRLYAARCEKSFRLAYPRRNVEHSTTLRDKFKSTIPTSYQKQLTTARSLGLTMNSTDLTWSTILSLASCWDAENDSDSSDGVQVWSTSIKKSLDQTDACTQGGMESKLAFYDSPRHRRRSFTARSVRGNVSLAQPLLAPPVNQRSSSLPRDNRTCHYCKIKGHIKSQCWRLHGLCLVCGSNDHSIKDCPNRRTLQKSKAGSNPGRQGTGIFRGIGGRSSNGQRPQSSDRRDVSRQYSKPSTSPIPWHGNPSPSSIAQDNLN